MTTTTTITTATSCVRPSSLHRVASFYGNGQQQKSDLRTAFKSPLKLPSRACLSACLLAKIRRKNQFVIGSQPIGPSRRAVSARSHVRSVRVRRHTAPVKQLPLSHAVFYFFSSFRFFWHFSDLLLLYVGCTTVTKQVDRQYREQSTQYTTKGNLS